MKNSFLFILFLIFYASNVFSENLLIEAKNISLDKNTEISIFENNVTIKTEDNNTIKSDYVEYNKKKGFLRLKKNIVARDSQNNIIKTDYAEYYEKDNYKLAFNFSNFVYCSKSA